MAAKKKELGVFQMGLLFGAILLIARLLFGCSVAHAEPKQEEELKKVEVIQIFRDIQPEEKDTALFKGPKQATPTITFNDVKPTSMISWN